MAEPGQEDEYRIMPPRQPHPDDGAERPQGDNHISAQDFEELKKKTGYRCLTCWAVEGKPNWRDSRSIVKLQQGLRDPEQAPTKDNIMPWCQHCSRHYRDHFVFDDRGHIRAVASIEPVTRASLRVQQEAFRFLQAKSE